MDAIGFMEALPTMSKVITRRETCRLCGGKEHELILRYAPSPIADAYVTQDAKNRPQESYPMDLFLCLGCGHSQILDVIDPAVLYRDYIYVTTSSLGLADHFKKNAQTLVDKLRPKAGERVVDIGSNDGTLLRCFKNLSFKVLGVEPAREIARQATTSGVETWPEFFDSNLAGKIKTDVGQAKIVTMNNLFANIDNLGDVAKGIREILAPDGAFVFESFYFVDFLENLVFDFMYHEHLSYFTVKPLQTFFGRLGMEIFDIERIPTKGGSMRCFVQHKGGPNEISSRVAEHIAYEQKIGVQQPGALFKDYMARINRQKSLLVQELQKQKAMGKTVAGFGASATTTTLIYHFGVTDMIDFMIDDNPAKQGTFSPGCHIPVLPSSALRERNPDVLVMLAWRYVDPILRNHRSYLEQGGTVLVPLPEFRVIKG